MATNLERMFFARMRAADALYDTDQHEECLMQLKEPVFEPLLPRAIRLQVNMLLSDGHDDLEIKEAYRLEAETVYAEIRAIWPDCSETYPKQERKLRIARNDLDEMKAEMEQLREERLAAASAETEQPVDLRTAAQDNDDDLTGVEEDSLAEDKEVNVQRNESPSSPRNVVTVDYPSNVTNQQRDSQHGQSSSDDDDSDDGGVTLTNLAYRGTS